MKQILQNQKDKVKKVFDNVYDKYDLMNDIMSLGIHRLWKKDLIYLLIPSINTKLIDRHPHVFNESYKPSRTKINWESQKHLEKKRGSRLDGVPSILPSIIFSQRIQEKASLAGFDWNNIEDVWLKIDEEINELKIAKGKNDLGNIHEEIGDLLFTVINLSRQF